MFSPHATDVRSLDRKGRKTHFANYAYLQRLQDLRENSEQDTSGWQTQHGPIGPPSRPSNTVGVYTGGHPLQQAPGHGGSAASALAPQAQHALGQPLPPMAVGTNVALPQALQALIATGTLPSHSLINLSTNSPLKKNIPSSVALSRAPSPPGEPDELSLVFHYTLRASSKANSILHKGPTTIRVADERQRQGANPHQPAFLAGIAFDPNNPRLWFENVLPYVEGLTFNVEGAAEANYMGPMLNSPHLPHLYAAVTKLDIPGFYWFAGAEPSRGHNPHMVLAKNLPKLRQIVFRMHTAGMTVSRWNEKEMIDYEKAGNLALAKERRALKLPKVVAKYELDSLLACRALQRVRVEYIECEMTRANTTRGGDPVQVLRALQIWLNQELNRVQHRNVVVELVRVG